MFLRAVCVCARRWRWGRGRRRQPSFCSKIMRAELSFERAIVSMRFIWHAIAVAIYAHFGVFIEGSACARTHTHSLHSPVRMRNEAITAHNIATNTHRARWILYTFTTVVSYRNRSLLKGHSPLSLPIRIRLQIQWKFYALRWIDPWTRTIHRKSFERTFWAHKRRTKQKREALPAENKNPDRNCTRWTVTHMQIS